LRAIKASKRELEQIRIEYRSHQLLNIFAQDISANAVAALYFLVSFVATCALYCSIGYHSVIEPFLLLSLAFLLVLLFVLGTFLVNKAIDIYFESEKIYLDFLATPGLSAADFRFWKSCRPVKVKVGAVGSVETHDFLAILLESVILKSTIDLLLNF